jgi:hypothetical protein
MFQSKTKAATTIQRVWRGQKLEMRAGYSAGAIASSVNRGQGQGFNTTGQVALPGVEPRVTATL